MFIAVLTTDNTLYEFDVKLDRIPKKKSNETETQEEELPSMNYTSKHTNTQTDA